MGRRPLIWQAAARELLERKDDQLARLTRALDDATTQLDHVAAGHVAEDHVAMARLDHIAADGFATVRAIAEAEYVQLMLECVERFLDKQE